MDHIFENVHTIVPEETLHRISKGPLVKFALECEDDQYGSRIPAS